MRISQIFKVPRRTRRVAHIARKCASHGLGFLVSKLGIQEYLPTWARIVLPGGEPAELVDLPARLAKVLEELGPTFVKLGQVLSTRPDLLSPEYIECLQRICHHVAPFSGDVARSVVEEELGLPVSEVFSDFSDEPVASGSVAQVHAARLSDGTQVVVKVRRPRIEKIIDDDLAIMEFLAAQADRLEEFRPLRLPTVVEEFAQGIRRELNFLTEAANTNKFHAAFKDKDGLLVPKVYWDYTTPSVVTLQRLTGTHLSELDRLPDADEIKPDIARAILDCFLTQFFEMGSFHADPHTGNILITPDHRIALIDFGLVGRVNETLRSQIGTFLIALGNEQMELAAEVLGEMGSLPSDVNAEEFYAEVASLMERHYSMPFDRVDLQRAFLEVMHVTRKYKVVMPRDFVLLAKALVTVGGIVTHLDPSLNVAEFAAPYGRRLVRGKLSPGTLKRAVTANAYHLGMLLKSAPRDLRQLASKLRSGAFQFAVRHEGLEKSIAELDRAGNRLALSIILAAIIISSTSVLAARIGPSINLLGWEASVLGLLGYLFGFILGVFLVIGILRSGRL